MKRLTASVAILAAAIASRSVWAAPSIATVQGTFGDHQNVTVIGSSFGAKSPAAPLIWADFNSDLNPGAGGINRAWNQVESMVWASGEGVGGTGCAKAADGNGAWTLRVDRNAWSTDGQRMYVYKKEKLNFLVTGTGQNWKSFRVWPLGNGYPNIYMSTSHGRIFVEEIGGDGGYWADVAPKTTAWQTQEIIFQASSFNQQNGKLTIRYDGQTVGDGAILTRSTVAPALMQWAYVVHGVAANNSSWQPAWSSNNRMWDDDVYVDSTWARVMLGNASTFSSCTKLEIQIPITWADGSIGMMARTGGAFATGSTAYLYVFDKDGNVNPVGYAVRIGAAGAGSPPEVGPQGPVASAGPDAIAAVNTDVPLHGAIQTGTAANISAHWSVVSGPGSVQFARVTDPNTTASFAAVGSYILQFSVTDGSANSIDTVRIDIIQSTLAADSVPPKNVFNPARGETFNIVHVLPEPGHLEADIIDRGGHVVKTIDGGDRPAGEQVMQWDGRNSDGAIVASGIYLVVRRANGARATNKVAVIK